ncbi:DUF4040 domain-containing protein [Mycolicibacterium novocastrense]|nr:DUF4040 domain-containing protein [Mycolicibacterium novocastrense]
MVLALSVVGFALAAVYALVAAPDIALVAVLVETMITLVFIAAFNRLPKRVPSSGPVEPTPPNRAERIRQWRNVIAGGVAGIAAFVSIWGFLSAPTQMSGVAEEYIRRTPSAHGEDAVTVIISDFRGLDTLGEITVLLVAVVGVATLLRRGRLW